MKPFEHVDAKTVTEAVGLLTECESKLIAGGTDLLGLLKSRVLPTYPELLTCWGCLRAGCCRPTRSCW
jgi:CO/xanthine dehydrogenase FAD-binding subunit